MVCHTENPRPNHMNNYKTNAEKTHLKSISTSQPLQDQMKYHETKLKPLHSLTKNKSASVSDIAYEPNTLSNPIIPPLKLSVESVICGRRLQMNAELLLLSTSNELWPISLHHLNKVERDFHRFSDCYEELLTCVKVFKLEIDEAESKIIQNDDREIYTESQVACLNDLVETGVTLMELVYQTVYIISSSRPSWKEPAAGLLNRKTIISAIDEVELCCLRFQEVLTRTSYTADDNIPRWELETVMLYACNQFSSSLTYLAICCRTAAANMEVITSNTSFQSVDKKYPHYQSSSPFVDFSTSTTSNKLHHRNNLFQLGMQSVSKNSQCLLTSVKNYVEDRNPENRFITESFATSVSVSIKAFASIATSSKYVKYPAILPNQIKETKNKIFGACMNLISPTIEFLVTIPSIIPSSSTLIPGSNQNTTNSMKRANQCIASMREAVAQLQQTLSFYQNY